MEELFVYSLLYSIGYEKYDEYREALDNLFCCTPEDEILLDLEGRDYKDAMKNGLKDTNRKYKVYNFVENCQNVNYNIKYEILSHKIIAKIKKRNIIRI